MYVYWVTSQRPTQSIPMLFATEEKAERDAMEQNSMHEDQPFIVVEVEVF